MGFSLMERCILLTAPGRQFRKEKAHQAESEVNADLCPQVTTDYIAVQYD